MKKWSECSKAEKEVYVKTALVTVATGAAAIGLICIGTKHYTKWKLENSWHLEDGEKILKALTEQTNSTNGIVHSIDEDIFARVAPMLEEAIINKSVEKWVFEDAYDLGDMTNKLVTIKVEQVVGE